MKKTLRVCPKGHKYYKSSDCPTCPICANEGKPESGFLSLLYSPARNALANQGILTLAELARFSEKEILQIHGMGPASMPTLRKCLADAGLKFRD